MKLNIFGGLQKLFEKIVNWFKNNPDAIQIPDVGQNTDTNTEPDINDDVSSSSDDQQIPANGIDEVNFSELIWSYGGFKGEKSLVNPEAAISKLTFSGDTLYYKWAKGGCEKFGAVNARDFSRTVCCLFLKNKNGKFVGGKFDWISTDRLSRGLENCHDGYSGWNLKDIPNPAEAVFLIAGVSTPNGSTSSGKRTNAIKGTWKR